MQILRSHSSRCHGSRSLGLDSASLLQCPGGKRSRATQGHAWCCLPGSSGPPSMLTHRPSPWASLWFQERATTLPGEAFQPHWLLGQAAYLSKKQEGPDRYWVTTSENSSLQNHRTEFSNPMGHCHAIVGGLSQGPALTAPPGRLKRDEAA